MVKTLDEMQAELDKEIAWRIKEISVFNEAAGWNNPSSKPYIRAGIAMLYAHWEGFIKKSSEIYLMYVESRALSYKDLRPCFAVFGLKKRLNILIESKKSDINIEAMEFILDNMGEVAKFQIDSAVNTRSNLSREVFENIARSLGIDPDPDRYKKIQFINSKLVDKRNQVAHGNYLEIRGREFAELIEDVLNLMRQYKTDIENAASLKHYRRTA